MARHTLPCRISECVSVPSLARIQGGRLLPVPEMVPNPPHPRQGDGRTSISGHQISTTGRARPSIARLAGHCLRETHERRGGGGALAGNGEANKLR